MLEVREVSCLAPSYLSVCFYSFKSISETASVSGFICRQAWQHEGRGGGGGGGEGEAGGGRAVM